MKKNTYFKTIVTVVVLVAFLLLNFLGKVKVELNAESLVVKGIFTQSEVSYDDIETVELIDDLNYGSRVGVSTFTILSGTYTNAEFGKYKLMAYRNVAKHIVVKYDGQIVVFNQDSIEATEALYEELSAKVD